MISAFQALYSEPKYDTDTGAIHEGCGRQRIYYRYRIVILSTIIAYTKG